MTPIWLIMKYGILLVLTFDGVKGGSQNGDLRIVEQKYADINTAKDRKEEATALMQPYKNWDQMLSPAPMAIAVLGQLMLIATETDFSLEDKPPKNGFQHLHYPNSFRASLVQISNVGWDAFNKAHTNMDQIRLHTSNVDIHVKSLVKLLMQGTKQEVDTLVPSVMKNIKRIADTCVTLSGEVESQFIFFMKITGELLEASTNSKGVYEEKLKETEAAINVAKTREEEAKKEKEALNKEYQRINEDIEKAQKTFHEALESGPSTFKLLGMGLLDSFISVIRIIPTFPVPDFGSDGDKHEDTFIQSDVENEEGRSKRRVYKFADEINKHIQTLVSVATSGKGKGEKTPDWNSIEDVRLVNLSLSMIMDHIKSIEEYSDVNQVALKMCKEGVRLSNNLLEMGKNIQSPQAEVLKILISDAEDLLENSQNFYSQAALFLQTTFTNPKGPRMSKQKGGKSSSSLIQAEFDNYRRKVDVTTQVLKDSRKRQENVNKDMKDNNERLMKTLTDLAELDLKKIDFDSIRDTLVKGLKAIEKVREQWGKMVQFFQMISNLVKIKYSDSISQVTNYADAARMQKEVQDYVSDVTRDLIYEQAFQASNLAHLVNIIASTYVEVSSNHLMDSINSLGGLVALDPKTDAIEIDTERKKLLHNCREAQKRIKALAEEKHREYDESIHRRIEKIESIRPLIPEDKSKEENSPSDRKEESIDKFV